MTMKPLSISGGIRPMVLPEYAVLFRAKPRELILDLFPTGEDVCLRCPTKVCCKLEPPHVAPVDLRQTFQFKSTQPGFMALIRRQHSNTCQHGPCMFFDPEKKLCTIYQNRPFDCQVFPLDISEYRNRLYWVVYRDDRCELSRLITSEAIMYAERTMIPWLGDYLIEFAKGAVHPGLAEKAVLLRELRFPTPTFNLAS
mgnify:CR=1 FL=1